MADPKYTDAHRWKSPYTPAAEQGDGYLQRRFKEIAQRQREEAAARLKNVIANRRFK